MSVKLDWDGDSTHDLVTKQFYETTRGLFFIVTEAILPLGYEARIMSKAYETMVFSRHPSSPETAEREAIAEMTPIWLKIQAEIQEDEDAERAYLAGEDEVE
jgi:hypothetical protein